MSNKLDTLFQAIVTKLTTLVSANGTGVLRSVVTRPINPLTETVVPIVGVLMADLNRQGGSPASREWTGGVMIALCTRCQGAVAPATISELVAQVEAVLDALPTDGTAKGSIDQPRFSFWWQKALDAQAPVGAVLEYRLRISGPLLIPPPPEEP